MRPSQSEYRKVKSQLDEVNRAVNLEQNLDAAKSNETMASRSLKSQEDDVFRLRGGMVRYSILEHTYESDRQLYGGLFQRLREAGIVSSLDSSEIDVIDLARIHTRPAGIGCLTKVVLGFVLGIALGLGVVLLFEALNTKIRNINELEQISELVPLAVVPLFKRKARTVALARILEMIRDPKSLFPESLLGFRSSLLLSAVGRQPQVILITSGTAAEGKSTTAMNLAVALSQLDTPTLLIDCDLRRPLRTA